MLSEIFIVILSVVIILIIIYMYFKEQDTYRKFKILASKIDTINRQLYSISKNFSKEIENHKKEVELEINLVVQESNMSNRQIDFSEIDAIKSAVEQVLYEIDEMKGIDSRVISLENGMKNAVLERNSAVDKSKQIITLYQHGKSIEDISSELHISKTEVEFALKLARI